MPILLALETSGRYCSVALLKNDSIKGKSVAMERGHDRMLMPIVQEIMQDAAVAFSDLTAVIATIGPGSFTGVRVGLAAAQGFMFSLNIAGGGITTFEAMIAQVDPLWVPQYPRLTLINSMGGDYYGQVFDSEGNPVEEARLWQEHEVDGAEGYAVIFDREEERFARLSHRRQVPPRAEGALASYQKKGAFLPLNPYYLKTPAPCEKLI